MTEAIVGGSFLLQALGAQATFIPEEASEELKSLSELSANFSKNEVMPNNEKIEQHDYKMVASLVRKAGELGLLMAEIPEEFGGLGLGKIASTFIAENITHQGSFSVAFMCHTGIGTLPLETYGTVEQKQKYLAKLASGEWLGAYSLTEAGSGSDALGAKAKAVLSPDGKDYILNGEKVYVTNGSIADFYTIFAKIDGEKFTAFLVERNTPGLTIGKEEKKMGIHGSSTTVLVLNDLKVPVENVLGEVGKGHHIAFNVLNVGRWKLGAACVGACKRLMEITVPYTKQRTQFQKPIASFELIRDKIATQGILTYLTESIVYRYAYLLDEARAKLDPKAADYDAKRREILKDFAIEASIAKVYGSEALHVVADEAVQALGGYGFCEEYGVERFYRDNRINRIFEGTNEINRMIITSTLLKKAMAGQLALMQRLQEVLAQLKTGFPSLAAEGELKTSIDAVESLKRLAVYVAGVAVQKYAAEIDKKQNVLAFIADIITQVYALESGVMRAQKIAQVVNAEKAKSAVLICQVASAEQVSALFAKARQMLMNIASDEVEFVPYAKALDRLTPQAYANTANLREQIAVHFIAQEKYEL